MYSTFEKIYSNFFLPLRTLKQSKDTVSLYSVQCTDFRLKAGSCEYLHNN